MNSLVKFAKQPLGIVAIVMTLGVLCCLGTVLSGLFSSSKPAPSMKPATTFAQTTAPATTLEPPPPAPVVVATTTTAAAAPKPSCHPNYDVCLPITSDIDCGQIPYRNFHVTGGKDPYRLDADHDGIACET